MPSTFPPKRRRGPFRRARGITHLVSVISLGLLASLVPPAGAAPGSNAGISKFNMSSWGTNRLEGTPFSARVWDIAVKDDTAYFGGEFTALAPTIDLAGAVASASGLPEPGFPKIDDGQVNVAAPDGQGGWFIGGSFSSLNGASMRGLAHILSNGTIDTNWVTSLAGANAQTSGSFTVTGLAVSGPWVYVGGEFTRFAQKDNIPGRDRNHIARVGIGSGTVDLSWDPNVTGSDVRSIAVAPDGTTYFAGTFSAVKGVARPGVAAFRNDGSLSDWVPQVPAGAVRALAVSPDGARVYLGGTSLVGVDVAGAPTFPPLAAGGGGVQSLAMAKDGSLLFVGGDFNTLGGQPRSRVAAVNPDGSLDSAFNPGAGGAVAAMTISDDGRKVFIGGTFSQVRGELRNNLAAIDAATGALDAWNPNATGAVAALSASGSLVYAGGAFRGLGSSPRTYLGAIDIRDGSALPFAPLIQNLNAGAAGKPAVIQALAFSADRSRLFIGGNFDHVNGTPRTHIAALILPNGELDPNFLPGEPQGTVRSIHVEGNTVYIGGDFDSVQIPASLGSRPDNNATCGSAPGSSKIGNRCVWQRSLLAALDANSGVLNTTFRGPESTGPGLIGQGGKKCTATTTTQCGNGALKAIRFSADKRQLFAAGTFSAINGKDHIGMYSIYADGPNRGKLTPWQPKLVIPIFDIDVAGNGMLFAAAGGAGGRALRFDPQISGGPTDPTWSRLFDGDGTAVSVSDTTAYFGGHYDWVEGGAYRRKHANAFDFNGNMAQNWDPELDTSEGVFTAEVVPGRAVIYGGNFSRINRRPQPGIGIFPAENGQP